MSNMSYCRFRNTARDLRDCIDHLEDDVVALSEEERAARRRLIDLCCDVFDDYGHEIGRES